VDKKTRGLPPSFQLDVARAAVERPVQLGDYLDEEEAPPVAKPVAPPDPTAAPVELLRGRHTEPAAPSTSAPRAKAN
jgi:hypothetical protein